MQIISTSQSILTKPWILSTLIASLLLCLTSSLHAQTASGNWILNPTNGHEYMLVNCGTWGDCKQIATSEGAYLVTISNQVEQQWLMDNFGSTTGNYYWIGLTDQTEEGTWVWDNGEIVNFIYWAVGEPNNGGGYVPDEDYAAMNHHVEGNGTWNDLKFDADYYGTILTTNAIIERVRWQVNPVNGHEYTVLDCGSWTSCKNTAKSLGAHLVTINDQSEQEWLVSTFGSSSYFWIGLTDEANEGTWVWENGEAVIYTNWASGEPNNGDTTVPDEDYAAINHHVQGNGTWNDIKDDAFYGYTLFTSAIVERPVVDTGITVVLDSVPDSHTVFNFSSNSEKFKLTDAPRKTGESSKATKFFTGLSAGSYSFKQTRNSSFYLSSIQCTPSSIVLVDLAKAKVTVNYKPGTNVTCVFTNEKYATAYIYKYNDIDGSGKRGSREPYLSGWEMHATDVTGVRKTQTTGRTGLAIFNQLRPGTIELCETQQSGWSSTFPGEPTDGDEPCLEVTLAAGQRVIARFGNQQGPGTSVRASNEVDAILIEEDDAPYEEDQSEVVSQVFMPLVNR